METKKKADRKEALESLLKAYELVKSDLDNRCGKGIGFEPQITEIKSELEKLETPEFKMVDLPEQTEKNKNSWGESHYQDAETCYCCGKRVETAKAYWFAQSNTSKVFDVKDKEANNLEDYGGSSIGWFALGSECKNKLPKTHTERKPHWS